MIGLPGGPPNGLVTVDLTSGKIQSETLFFGRGKDFRDFPKAEHLNPTYFTILDDGTIILSHGMMMETHDLWML